ncbi:MAG: hypothetical protein WBW93_18225 [Steroidobacteraceae bacterium]
MANTVVLTKLQVATSQLRLSIALFMEEREHISVITLAGAAEEILGKLAAAAGSTPALNRRAEGARRLHVALWGNDPGDKVFKNVKNKTRNELKHLSCGAPLTIGLERECLRMLDRAVENYRLLHKRAATFIVQYERHRETLRQKYRDA